MARRMKEPWCDIDKAFEPMQNETVLFVCKREKDADMRQAVEVTVFTDGTGYSLSEDQISTDREDILVGFKRKDWPYVRTMRRGDILKRCKLGFKEYAIQSVEEDEVMGLVIKARSI